MNIQTREKIYADAKNLRYLRENSHWYKTLNRNPDAFKDMVEEMKIKHSLRPTDKISNVFDTIDIISQVIASNK